MSSSFFIVGRYAELGVGPLGRVRILEMAENQRRIGQDVVEDPPPCERHKHFTHEFRYSALHIAEASIHVALFEALFFWRHKGV